MARFKSKLKELTCRKMPGKVSDKIKRINQVIRGWINYYALGSMKKVMTVTDAHLRTRLRMNIWKQWKVPKKRQWGLQKLGVGKDLARLTAYYGDRYYWVATKTCVVKAISKEVFMKAGLVSCLDYYTVRHALKLC
ncbi:MAG: group II intron maturase-specific domain-containing protein [Succiniclasticum sp.]|uniref:group II intron maturase-specific domain-containing protein n=1 Tax=Succiniclasticum sp. TaxID=2775030 RepID=UPI002A91E79D|nr:group II intron maturase-specific domain-containing protein [Succiniclasticum sp.]MDY6289924.1 group II intron maturase-specific domain-containing protein [Succiniclasticum sp.]